MSCIDNKSYRVEISPQQLQVLTAAAALLARLGMGQVEYAFSFLPLRPAGEHAPLAWGETMAAICEKAKAHTLDDIDGRTRFLAVTDERVRQEAKTAWQLHEHLASLEDGLQPDLELTAEQLQVLSMASELLARLGMGQFEDALAYLPLKRGRERDFDLWHEHLAEFRLLLRKHMLNGIDGWARSLSITSDQVSEESRLAWDLYQVFRHRLAWDRAYAEGIVKPGEPRLWPEMMQVSYDHPMKTSIHPLATINEACCVQ